MVRHMTAYEGICRDSRCQDSRCSHGHGATMTVEARSGPGPARGPAISLPSLPRAASRASVSLPVGATVTMSRSHSATAARGRPGRSQAGARLRRTPSPPSESACRGPEYREARRAAGGTVTRQIGRSGPTRGERSAQGPSHSGPDGVSVSATVTASRLPASHGAAGEARRRAWQWRACGPPWQAEPGRPVGGLNRRAAVAWAAATGRVTGTGRVKPWHGPSQPGRPAHGPTA
jgi:hypothetical protein